MVATRSLVLLSGASVFSDGQSVTYEMSPTTAYEKGSIVTLHNGQCEWKCKHQNWCNPDPDSEAPHRYFLPDGTAWKEAWEMLKGEGLEICQDREAPSGPIPKYKRPTETNPSTFKFGDRVQLHDGKCQWDCIEPNWCNNIYNHASTSYILPKGDAVAQAWKLVEGDAEACKKRPECKKPAPKPTPDAGSTPQPSPPETPSTPSTPETPSSTPSTAETTSSTPSTPSTPETTSSTPSTPSTPSTQVDNGCDASVTNCEKCDSADDMMCSKCENGFKEDCGECVPELLLL